MLGVLRGGWGWSLFGVVWTMAGLGFTALTRHASPRRRALDCALVALLMFSEYRPLDWYSAQSVSVPDPLSLSDAYQFLATESDRGAVIELPAADENGYRTPLMVVSVYGSAGHLRRVVATHGQTLPRVTTSLLETAERLPAESEVQSLRDQGCSRVVIHRNWAPLERTIAVLRDRGLPVLWESKESVVFSLQR